ncbi:MAG: pseudouridine synthase [Desulfovibrionaceae bacterium]|nr:pseudouridine synthase [Desulfovibrionaceae bacterium]
MELRTMFRNNDPGMCMPTGRGSDAGSSGNAQEAQELTVKRGPVTPHLPNSEEVEQTLSMMEAEAAKHNVELLRIHSGLNRERINRLLDLLR